MQNFDYAHKDTQNGERSTPTAQFNPASVSKEIQEIRKQAFKEEIPVSDDETLNFLCTLMHALMPKNILELGTAVGVSGAAMLEISKNAHLTTIEKSPGFHARAIENFESLNVKDRVTAILGDAGEVISSFDGQYDFIFLDCAKVQYIKYLPTLKKLLKKGGVLLADDVLLFGYVTGEEEVPKKRKMLVEHVKEYITAVTDDKELATTILNVGNGLALSVKL